MIACRFCGQEQRSCAPGSTEDLVCCRCGSVLRRGRRHPITLPLACAVAALLLFIPLLGLPFLTLDLYGRIGLSNMTTGIRVLDAYGFSPLSVLVGITLFIAPVLRLVGICVVHGGILLGHTPRILGPIYAGVQHLAPWSMLEIYALGAFVAYTKSADITTVLVGPSAWVLGLLILCMSLMDASSDPHSVLDRLPPTEHPRITADLAGQTGLGQRAVQLQSTMALLLAAFVCYALANVYPILTVVRLGAGSPSTIVGGIQELAAGQMWALAILVLFASLLVPIFKILAITSMVWVAARGGSPHARAWTRLYKIVEYIGRWSMIDVFMLTVLTGLVQMDALASVTPNLGAIFFASVVVLTMYAADTFNPTLLWPAASSQQTG